MPRPPLDALLCESCGYDLSASADARGGRCPECGRSIDDSRPDRRVGSSMQRSLAPAAFVRTTAAVLATTRHALRDRFAASASDNESPAADRSASPTVWDRLAIEWRRSSIFAAAVVSSAAALAWLGVVVSPAGREMLNPLAAIGWIVEGGLILFGLGLIEFVGIQLIARKHGWRITPRVAAAVCAHAAPGWLIGGLLFGVGWNLGHLFTIQRWLPDFLPVPFWLSTPMSVLALAGAFVGLLHYETLVYIGMRRCRFANEAGVRTRPLDASGVTPGDGPARVPEGPRAAPPPGHAKPTATAEIP